MMKQLERVLIQADSSADDFIPLNALDLLTGHLSMAGVYFFNRVPDIQRLKKALKEALNRYPIYSASLVRRNGSVCIYRNNVGVWFSVCEADFPQPDVDAMTPIDEQSPLIEPPAEGDILSGMTPLSSFKVILFNDNTWALAVRAIHSIVDGTAFSHFLRAWGMLYRGETPPLPSSYSREEMAKLGVGNGHQPSAKFSILPSVNFSLGQTLRTNKTHFEYINVDIDAATLERVVTHSREHTDMPLSSSDIIHAIAWRAFALSNRLDPNRYCRIYTASDLKRIKELGIPDDFEGNATIERFAQLPVRTLSTLDIAAIGMQFREQVKPVTAMEIRLDIAYLNRELALGRTRESNGTFTSFVRGSLVDCLDGTGVIVNDYRFLDAAHVTFEDKTFWFETVQDLGFAAIFVYRKLNGAIVFRYVGERSSLAPFAQHVRASLCMEEPEVC